MSLLSSVFNDPMDIALSNNKRPAPVQLSFRPKKRARVDSSLHFLCSTNLSTLAEWASISKTHATFFDTYLHRGLDHLLSAEE